MVSRNELLEDNVPSLTDTVMVVVPKALVTGVMAIVRLLPAPPNTILVLATRLVLEEMAERTNESAGVSRSLTVKEVVAILSSFVVRLGMLEMVGGLLTVKTPLRPLVNPAALAVNCLFVPPTSISRFV